MCAMPVRGDRRRIYCSPACKQVAYRAKKAQLSNATAVYYVRYSRSVSQGGTGGGPTVAVGCGAPYAGWHGGTVTGGLAAPSMVR